MIESIVEYEASNRLEVSTIRFCLINDKGDGPLDEFLVETVAIIELVDF